MLTKKTGRSILLLAGVLALTTAVRGMATALLVDEMAELAIDLALEPAPDRTQKKQLKTLKKILKSADGADDSTVGALTVMKKSAKKLEKLFPDLLDLLDDAIDEQRDYILEDKADAEDLTGTLDSDKLERKLAKGLIKLEALLDAAAAATSRSQRVKLLLKAAKLVAKADDLDPGSGGGGGGGGGGSGGGGGGSSGNDATTWRVTAPPSWTGSGQWFKKLVAGPTGVYVWFRDLSIDGNDYIAYLPAIGGGWEEIEYSSLDYGIQDFAPVPDANDFEFVALASRAPNALFGMHLIRDGASSANPERMVIPAGPVSGLNTLAMTGGGLPTAFVGLTQSGSFSSLVVEDTVNVGEWLFFENVLASATAHGHGGGSEDSVVYVGTTGALHSINSLEEVDTRSLTEFGTADPVSILPDASALWVSYNDEILRVTDGGVTSYGTAYANVWGDAFAVDSSYIYLPGGKAIEKGNPENVFTYLPTIGPEDVGFEEWDSVVSGAISSGRGITSHPDQTGVMWFWHSTGVVEVSFAGALTEEY